MTHSVHPDERTIGELLALAVPGAIGAERISGPGSAPVYRVVDPALTSVVVKIVGSDVARRVTRLHREVGRTPGLLGLLRAGGAGDFGYLVFPHLGQSLADRIEGQPISAGELARMLSDVADGLNRLHRLGYVHGDVKPANILITADGTATLTDLDDVAVAGSPPLRLTPGFGPPEQLAGAPVAPTTDLYALVAVMVTALTGSTEWMSAPALALNPARLPQLGEPALDALRSDLAADPSARTVGPGELIDLLRLPATSQPTPATPAPVRTGGRHAALSPPSAHQVTPPRSAIAVDGAPGGEGDSRADGWHGGGGDELIVAARRAWGFVDLRAATIDRLPLQLVPAPEPVDEDPPERSIWRRPAMVVSLVVSLLLIITGLLLWLVF